MECDVEDYEQDCSDAGSSSSSGTVKLGALSNLDLRDPNPWLPLKDCYPIKQPCSPYLLHHNGEEGGNVPPQMCPSAPNAFPNGSNLGLKITQSMPNLREASHQSGLGSGHSTRLEGAVYQVNEWDASVQLYTVATMSQKGGIEIHHHAQILVTIPKQKIDTGRICLSIIVTHGLRGDHTCNLEAGHSSLYFDDEPSCHPSAEPAKAQIAIIRNTCDMERPLHIYFASSYPASGHNMGMQVLPSFRPRNGRVLSESIILGEPVAPLVMKTKARSLYSTWKATPHPLSRVTQFKRIDTPPLYPLGLRDDLRIEVVELPVVNFPSLGSLAATDVVWDFDIKIQQLRGIELECCMSLYLEVSMASNRLVTIDSHGWIPIFFLVDGSLATEQSAEWRELNGQLTLFKQAHLPLGPIKLELNWQEPPDMVRSNDNNPYELLLPSVLDREVLSGSLTCKNIGTAFLANPGTKDDLELESDTYLPTMHKGYRLHLTHKLKAQNSLGQQQSTLSFIPEDLGADFDTGSDQSFVTPPENQVVESDPEPSTGPSPELEANNDPPGDKDPPQEGIESRQSGYRYWIWPALGIIIMIALLGNYWWVQTHWLPEAPVKTGNLPALRLPHEVETLTYRPLVASRFSPEAEELGSREEPTENLGLETITDSIIAGTESYGEEGWRWWRDAFDYTFGWPGPIYE